MALPESVSDYLNSLKAGEPGPLCVQVGPDGRVEKWWGQPDAYGLHGVSEGVLLSDPLPFAHELDVRGTLTLPFVTLESGHTVHAHAVPDRNGYFVILIAADREAQQHRTLQQTTNEVRLLNQRQAKLLDQLIEARADADRHRRDAERADALKAQFIASMSHEFRTPLTSVLGYAQLLTEAVPPTLPAAQHLAAIERGARHLLSMVDNLLDQARLAEGAMSVRTAAVNMRELVDDLTAMLAPLAADKGLSFAAYVDRTVPTLLESDDMRLRQILVNLLGNAIKFTEHGGVTLELAYADNVMSMTVADTGPGIPVADRERIFDAFERLESGMSAVGTGLGLNISRRLAGLLGGSIELDSAIGEGSRFRVYVPAADLPVPEPVRGKVAGRNAIAGIGRLHILLAEDNPDIVQLLQLYLVRAGHDLTLVDNGIDAVESALRLQPDLVLMDINMPKLNGFAATRRLRERGFAKPVVALTASMHGEVRDQAMESGCDGFLAKPIQMPELVSAIQRFATSR